MERVFQRTFNPVIISTPLDTQEVYLGEENAITAIEVFPAVKTLKAAGCGEIRPEMLKALNEGMIWLTRVCQVAWWFRKAPAPKDWQTGVMILNTQKGRKGRMQ